MSNRKPQVDSEVVDDMNQKTPINRKGRRQSSNKNKGKNKTNNRPKDLGKYGRNNDVRYYFVSPELAEQASQLSFQNVLGYGDLQGYQVPTILRLDVNPCPGVTYRFDPVGSDVAFVSEGPNYAPFSPSKSGLNLMSAKLYTTLSSFTGRTAQYAPQDVGLMILAIASIAETSEAIRRVLGLALTYNYRNRTLPLGLIASMGINSDDLAGNLSVYRMEFNAAITRINQIPLLDNIEFIRKSRELYQRVYADDPTDMSQLFYYMPHGYYVLDETGDEQGSILRYTKFQDVSGTMYAGPLSAYLAALNEQINAVLESSTLNLIYADLVNMANKLKVPTWKFDYCAENYIVMPEYNANALMQLHNTTIVGEPYNMYDPDAEENLQTKHTVDRNDAYPEEKPYVTGGNDVFCDVDKNNLVYNPMFWDSNYILTKRTIVDVPTDKPTTEDRIECLRWAACDSGMIVQGSDVGLTGAEATRHYATGKALPDHYVVKGYLFRNITRAGAESSIPFTQFSTTNVLAGNMTPTTYMSAFEHSPIFRGFNNNSKVVQYMMGQLQFYTDVDYQYVRRLVDLTYLGLFDFRV